MLGAQGYLPPERFRSSDADTRGDQFALAIVYVELRTGRNPLIPNRREQMSGRTPPDLGDLPVAERAVIARAVDSNPSGRWPSCRAFVDALARAA